VAAFLDAFRSKRVWLLIALGFASGLPLLLSGQALSAWATNRGLSIKTIGLFSLVSLPYSFKFLWAPLIDRYRVPFLGRRRGWMVLFQLAIAAAIFAMSGFDPKDAPLTLAALALFLAFFSASLDIATDAYRVDILPPPERASGTATFIFGYRVALLVVGAAAFVLSDHMPWPSVYQIMAVLLVTVGVAATWLAPEPEAVQPPSNLREAVVEPFREFFSRRGAILALSFVILYKFGDYLADNMLIPFLIKTGFSNTEIGALRKFVGFAGMSAGVMLGGGMSAKLGVRRALLTFGVLQAATNSGYLALAVYGKSYPLLVAAIGIDNFCAGLGAAAQGAYLISICHKSFSATQFALLSSASTIAGRLVSAASGYMVAAWGWVGFFAFTMVVAIPALMLLSRVPTERPASAAARDEGQVST
jgi:PAT family beta-lactamase induction signal transducer AmpG